MMKIAATLSNLLMSKKDLKRKVAHLEKAVSDLEYTIQILKGTHAALTANPPEVDPNKDTVEI